VKGGRGIRDCAGFPSFDLVRPRERGKVWKKREKERTSKGSSTTSFFSFHGARRENKEKGKSRGKKEKKGERAYHEARTIPRHHHFEVSSQKKVWAGKKSGGQPANRPRTTGLTGLGKGRSVRREGSGVAIYPTRLTASKEEKEENSGGGGSLSWSSLSSFEGKKGKEPFTTSFISLQPLHRSFKEERKEVLEEREEVAFTFPISSPTILVRTSRKNLKKEKKRKGYHAFFFPFHLTFPTPPSGG